jgi:hypothetical protein
MNVPGWAAQAPRAKHLLHAVGLEARPSLTRRALAVPSWSWFGAGLLLGAGLVLLLTHESSASTAPDEAHEDLLESRGGNGSDRRI